MPSSLSSGPPRVETTRHMRGCVESTIASRDTARQIKLGAGGLRNVEFTVQLLDKDGGLGRVAIP
ncbi:hypothetical protein JVW63_05885 [Flaviflexus sp. JY899]|uniref:PII-uridylyltransferase/Glutamine-synthetase adenylyltransferase domain-containing protein n=1 Tax=Flaviflexus equikiangi TaxID=2758573 RepID=A0ABS2TEZ6_9ACTO|nr:hypothetical protein [Flaviflexus equikiangi]